LLPLKPLDHRGSKKIPMFIRTTAFLLLLAPVVLGQ
jgi:hypothetical protein